MRSIAFLTAALFAHACSAQAAMSADRPVIPSDSGQLIVVATESWEATSGALQRFERIEDRWEPVSDLVEVVVGRSGLGWGTGLNPEQPNGPTKQEGDGRAPAGVFLLTQTFGYADSEATGLPYIHATRDVECVDDSDSQYYNRVLDRSDVEADWESHEEMRRRDELYRLGVIVAHNEAAVPRGGSCIFLHIWRGPGTTTSGCTAMTPSAMAEVASWLDAEEIPVLVQLPQSEYERLRTEWQLP